MPGRLSARSMRRRAMTGARWSRSSSGLRSMVRREVARLGLMPSTPTKNATRATAGSASSTSESSFCRRAMAAKDVSCGNSAMPWMTPVSCVGKKPLGTRAYMATLSSRVPTATARVRRWWASTQSSLPSYQRSRAGKKVSSPSLCRSGRSMTAQSMGVRDREMTAEMRMVTASVTANSRNRRPATSPMNSRGMSTATSDRVREMMVKPICPAPTRAACRGL